MIGSSMTGPTTGRETPVPAQFLWSEAQHGLFSSEGRFDAWTLTWRAAPLPTDAAEISAPDALRRLAAHGGIRRVPVGIIGPKEATDEERTTAERLGRAFALHGLQLLCGGRNGVMEAACKGCLEAGGQPIGLLPGEEWDTGNAYVAIPIATGIGPARNAILARACLALVAVGGGYGTLSEMAFGLHFNRPVYALGNAPFVADAIGCANVEEVMAHLARHVLGGLRAPVS